MFEHAVADTTAFALERRNFDYLPDEQAARWRGAFLSGRRARVAGPEKLIFELLNSCNLDCPICRVGQHGVNIARAMSLDVFDSVLAAVSTAKTVRLNGLGESTLLPNFAAYLDILASRKLAVELITNGSGRMVDYKQVFDIGGHVLVSWDAAQPAVFEQLRRPARWAEYVTRLEQIAGAAAASAAGGKCSLIFTLQKGNIGEVKGIVDLAAVLNISAVQVNIAKTPSTQWITANLEKVTADLAAAGQRAIAAGVTLFVPDQIAGVALPLERQFLTAASHCVAPWREAVIRWNGDVQTCNMFNPFTYGNIHRIPFNEIWQNRFAELFRAKLNEVDRHPYCRACAYIPSAYD